MIYRSSVVGEEALCRAGDGSRSATINARVVNRDT
jgi:hypothetical protein